MAVVFDGQRPDLGGNIRHGDTATFAPGLWRYLVERYGVGSVLDVGCGEGHAVKFFQRLGVLAHGIDGLRTNVERAVTTVSLHDLLKGPFFMPVDLVWSCEVAEHIAEDQVDYYLETLSNGKVIAMTHAIPEQAGHNHVNCQPSEYWIEKLAAYGYEPAHPNIEFYRTFAARDGWFNYFQKSGLVFTRR